MLRNCSEKRGTKFPATTLDSVLNGNIARLNDVFWQGKLFNNWRHAQ